MTAPLVRPGTDQVAVAWLRSLPGLNPSRVATSLPADNASWADTGFVTAVSIGGAPGHHSPLQNPIVQIDTWANNPQSQKPAWGKAGDLAQTILWATYEFRSFAPDLGADFAPTRILSVYPISEPRRLPGDEAGFARWMFELVLAWTTGPVTP